MSIYFIKIIIDDFVKVQMFFLIILLSAIPNFAYALSDTEYNDLISSSHDFKEADTEMNNLENVRHTSCYTSFLQRIQAKAR